MTHLPTIFKQTMITPRRGPGGSAANTSPPRVRGLRVLAPMLAACGIALLWLPAASLADSAYWSDSAAGTLRTGSLSGGAASTLLAHASEPGAIAIDPADGKIYFTDAGTGSIDAVALAGGAPQVLYSEPGTQPEGIAIDAATGTLYWADAGRATIRVGALTGATAQAAQTLYTEPAGARPVGLAIDAAAGRLYWTDELFASAGPGTIRVGALTGGSAQTLYTEPEGARPVGLAIDASTGTIYWTDEGSGAIRAGSVQGQAGGAARTLYEEGATAHPRGIAIDTATAELYWADAGSGTIQVGVIAGSAAPGVLFASEQAPSFPALLIAPTPAGLPKIAGHYTVGETLRCGTGSWSTDQPGANLYAAPQTYAYAWKAGDAAIPGASSAEYVPSAPGSYSCTVSAGNPGGAATQTSLPITVKPRPPAAAIAYPTSGSVFEQGQTVDTSFSCTEGSGGPGLASCKDGKGTSAPAGRLDTSHVGPHQYFVTAISKDGQRSRATVTVTIIARKPAPPPPPPRPAPPSPPPTPHPYVTITGQASMVGRRMRIVLACHRAACSGTLALRVRVSRATPAAHAGHPRSRASRAKRRRHSIQVLFLKTGYFLPAGSRRPVVLQLGPRAYRLLLATRRSRLNVRIMVSVRGGGSKHRMVSLRLPRKRGSRRR